MTLWCGSGSGSADPCLWLMDQDPAVFVMDPQDANKKLLITNLKKSFSAYYFLKVHLHHFSKINVKKTSQNTRNQGFSYYLCLMIEESGSVSGLGSIPLTNWSGSKSRRPKNTDPTDPDSGPDPQHCMYDHQWPSVWEFFSGCDETGRTDLQRLEAELEHQQRSGKRIIGCFSVASNVTGQSGLESLGFTFFIADTGMTNPVQNPVIYSNYIVVKH